MRHTIDTDLFLHKNLNFSKCKTLIWRLDDLTSCSFRFWSELLRSRRGLGSRFPRNLGTLNKCSKIKLGCNISGRNNCRRRGRLPSLCPGLSTEDIPVVFTLQLAASISCIYKGLQHFDFKNNRYILFKRRSSNNNDMNTDVKMCRSFLPAVRPVLGLDWRVKSKVKILQFVFHIV